MTVMYSFDHLRRMSDGVGLFEHAVLDAPDPAHGYCVDDVARGLVVISREQEPPQQLLALAAVYLRFLIRAQADDGAVRNRMDAYEQWTSLPEVDDAWGRALWAYGAAAARIPRLAPRAQAAFERGAQRRSPFLHAMCFAGLGAAELLQVDPHHVAARNLLRSAAKAIAIPGNNSAWPWPEPRLRYANAVIPQVLLHAGHLLEEPRWLAAGLEMLSWLVDVETVDEHLSVTPVGGWELGEPRPAFDQQPIEVAAIADASRVAFDISLDRRWLQVIERCGSWFEGDNDTGMPMTDPAHSRGYDGLTADGRNENCGAESTMAMLTTFQHLQRILVVA